MRNRLLTILSLAIMLFSSAPLSAQDSEVTTVINADFSVFTEGSEESPQDFKDFGTGSIGTYFTGWYQKSAAQAGGKLLVRDGGYVQTSRADISAHGGTAKVTLRVKAGDSYGGIVQVQLGYTGQQNIFLYDNEWHDVSVVLAGGTSSCYVKVSPFLSLSGILMQSLKVEQSASFIASPTVYQPENFDGTSFTAYWRSVSGATGYLVDVYSYDADGGKVYFKQNEPASSTYIYVEGLTPGTKYYLTVRATNGTAVSDPSEEIELVKMVDSLASPSNVTATDSKTAADGAFVEWDSVEDAESYIVTIYANRILDEAQNADILGDDFSKITEGTLESVEFGYDSNIDLYTQVSGWEVSGIALASGHLAISPFGTDGYLITPTLDLSADGGKFTAVYNMAEGQYGDFASGAEIVFSLLASDGTVLETQNVTLKEGFADYTLMFTKGTADCRLKVDYKGSQKLFFDSIRIFQLLPAGAVVRTEYLVRQTESTRLDIPSPALNGGDADYYTVTVTAVGRTVKNGDIQEIYSAPSAEVRFDVVNAVDGVEADASVKAWRAGSGRIGVRVAQPSTVEIFDLTGRRMASQRAEGETTIEVPSRGVVIVRIGERSFKLSI